MKYTIIHPVTIQIMTQHSQGQPSSNTSIIHNKFAFRHIYKKTEKWNSILGYNGLTENTPNTKRHQILKPKFFQEAGLNYTAILLHDVLK